MAQQQKARGRDRRRHARISVDLEGVMLGSNDRELTIRVLDLSRGGAQLAGPAEIKALLFRPKKYTHLPIPALLKLSHPGTKNGQTLLGRCRYLRKMPDGSYRAGFGFAQLQSRRWLDDMTASCQATTPRHPPRRHQLPDRRPDSGPAPAG